MMMKMIKTMITKMIKKKKKKKLFLLTSVYGCKALITPGSKLPILGMVIPPFIGNPYNGYINPYYWVDDHPSLYGNNWSLDPGTHVALPHVLTGFTAPLDNGQNNMLS